MVTIYALNEACLEGWFVENYRLFEFTKIEALPQKCQQPQNGDYIGWRGNRKCRIELEAESSNFFLHKSEIRDRIDTIICWKRNEPRKKWKRRELEEKEVIEVLPLFETWLG